MWPKIEKEMDESLANSAVELPSLVSVFTLGGRMRALANAAHLSPLASLRTLLAITKSVKRRAAVYRALGASARIDLAIEFAIRPLLSDIAAIGRSISEAEQKIKRLLENERKILYSHWSCPIDGFPINGGVDSSRSRQVGNYSTEWMKYHLGLYPERADYTATMKYQYTLSPYTREHIRALAPSNALGLAWDPQVLWNAIPFSFVIDYFAHVGNFLGQFKDRAVAPAVNILDFCHSINVKYTRDLHIEVKCEPRSSYVKQLVHGQRYSYYLREPAVPGQVEQLRLRGFSKYNVRMLGTLWAAIKL